MLFCKQFNLRHNTAGSKGTSEWLQMQIDADADAHSANKISMPQSKHQHILVVLLACNPANKQRKTVSTP